MGVPWETVQLTAFGRNKAVYFNILEEGLFFLLSNTKGDLFVLC